MKPKFIIVQKPDEGRPLLDYLAAQLGLSRRKAKHIIDSRTIRINDKRVWMAHHTLRAGDRVELPLSQMSSPRSIPVLYRDEHCVVVNKPPGMVSNGPGSVELVLRRLPGLENCRAAHRLDRDTSGCLLVVVREADMPTVIELFRQHAVAKQYRAIVKGSMAFDKRTVASAIDEQRAVTRVQVLDSNEEASHVSVSIETGRTHQIRKHLASIGHPVVGDVDYARLVPGRHASPGESSRQMLHAAELRLPHPFKPKTQIHARSPLPTDFIQTLRRLNLR